MIKSDGLRAWELIKAVMYATANPIGRESVWNGVKKAKHAGRVRAVAKETVKAMLVQSRGVGNVKDLISENSVQKSIETKHVRKARTIGKGSKRLVEK